MYFAAQKRHCQAPIIAKSIISNPATRTTLKNLKRMKKLKVNGIANVRRLSFRVTGTHLAFWSQWGSLSFHMGFSAWIHFSDFGSFKCLFKKYLLIRLFIYYCNRFPFYCSSDAWFSRPCGYISSFMELVNCESLSAMYCFLLSLEKLPKYVCYDFACGLAKFCRSRYYLCFPLHYDSFHRPPDGRESIFEAPHCNFVIDNFHITNHVVCIVFWIPLGSSVHVVGFLSRNFFNEDLSGITGAK
jgi:hypothetical protein